MGCNYVDDDMGKGGIDVLNTETGESTIVRERETNESFYDR